MNRLLLLFTLFALIISDSNVDECSIFESSIATSCVNLGDDVNRCYYSEGKCKTTFKSCEAYNPDSGFNDTTCTSIILADYQTTKCVVVVEGTKKQCVSKTKTCEETTDQHTCKLLDAGENKRCVFTNGKCSAHHNYCTNANEGECNNNIPLDSAKKCEWVTDCQELDRKCNQSITYIDQNVLNISPQYCYKLKVDDSNQVCVKDEQNCKAVDKSCANGNGDQAKCQEIKPLANYGYYYKYDDLKYCSYSSDTCSEETKKCNQYIKGSGSISCEGLAAENPKKKCVYNSEKDECTEQYTTCSSYTEDTSITNHIAEDCKIIKPINRFNSEYEKCEFERSQCISKPKDCNEIKDKEICNQYKDYGYGKYCLFLESNNTCVNSFGTCEEYKTNVNKNDCELIKPQYLGPYTYKCIFNEEDQTCKKEKMACEDYKGQDPASCSSLSSNLDSYFYECKFIDGICKKEYRSCSDYQGNNKAECEAIRDDPYKCVYNTKYNQCYQETGTCNEYTGKDPIICSSYYSKNENKRCVLVNNKCIEKEYYYSCSDYEGTNIEICESITLSEKSKKCVYTNKGCEEQNKVCEDAKDESECANIDVSDPNKKHCVFINNECKELFKNCEIYNAENTITPEECESIILNEKYNTNSYKFRCKYTPPVTTGGKGTCTEVSRNCEEFSTELIKDLCTFITPTDYLLKKCVYNDDDQSCTQKIRTCAEKSYDPNASDEYCKQFSVSSSDKLCVASVNGCTEIEKENNSNNSNSSYELKLSKMAFILLYLLF